MAKEEETKTEEPMSPGLVTLTGEIGIGMRMPDGKVIELNDVPVGMAQVLAYLVQKVSKIEKNIS